jgi:hypothetical protein
MSRRRLAMPTALIFAIGAAAIALLLLSQAAAASSGTIRTSSATTSVSAPAQTFTVSLISNASVTTTGAETDVTFNQALIQVQSIAIGSSYSGSGQLTVGTSGQTQSDAINEANSTGTLNNVTAFTVPPATIPAGDATFAVITFKSACGGASACAACGTSLLDLSGAEMLDGSGQDMTVTPTDGSMPSTVVDVNTPFGTQDWTVTAPDSDCDGLQDANETHIGTDPNGRCAATTTVNDEGDPDRWFSDFNDSGTTNGQDVAKFAPAYNKNVNQGPFGGIPGVRFDFSNNNIINGQDVARFSPVYNKKCA